MQPDAPAGWADPLKPYHGSRVWTWQNHPFNVTNRIGDDTVPLGLGHGTNDMVIGPTQARPFYGPLDASRHCWGGVVTDAGHSWLGFWGPTIAADNSLAPFAAFQVVRNETVPGLSHASGDLASPPEQTGGYHQNLAWSASWDTWDGVPQDTATLWQISLRAEDAVTHTADVTPRRSQQFHPVPGALARWRNLRVGDGVEVQSGMLAADAFGLMTVTNVTVSPTGNRLRLELETPPNITSAKAVGADFHIAFTTVSGKNYFVQRSAGMTSTWTNLSTSLPGTGAEILFTHVGALESSGYRLPPGRLVGRTAAWDSMATRRAGQCNPTLGQCLNPLGNTFPALTHTTANCTGSDEGMYPAHPIFHAFKRHFAAAPNCFTGLQPGRHRVQCGIRASRMAQQTTMIPPAEILRASLLARRRTGAWAGFTLVEIMIVVAIIGLLAAIAIPNFARARKRAQATTTLNDLRIVDEAKNQFALENRQNSTFTPKVADIRPYLQVGSRLYMNTPLSNFRDIFGRSILMGDLATPPLVDDATRDEFSSVVTNNQAFWGQYCR